jgi:hypothetical protein
MRSLLKYGVSVLALTVGIGAANAQNMEEKRPIQGQEVQRPDAGAGQQEQRGGVERQKRGSNEAVQAKPDGERSKEQTGQAEDRKTSERAARAEGGKKPKAEVRNVQITKEKKTVIRDRVINHAPKRYGRSEINFNLSVGTAVPRNVVVYDIPPTFVDIVPEFQGYDYIVVGDVLLIIDPDTREIVDVIDV